MPLPLLVLALFGRFAPSPLANARVYIVRHAEKPDEGDGLTTEGVKRARAYVGFFRKDPLDGTPLRLSHIFAATDSEKSHRPRLTAEPLASTLRQRLDLSFTDKDPKALVRSLRSVPYGNRILIVWRHGGIPKLLAALGADASTLVPEGKWPDDVYDRVIVLRYDAKGRLIPGMSRLVQERLMPGDKR